MEETYDEAYVVRMRNRAVKLEQNGKYWTDADKKKLKESFDSGMDITRIAVLLQRTEPAIIQQIEEMDLFNRKEYPMRRRSMARRSGCLCDRCPHYQEACSNRERCPMSQEGK